MNDEQRAHDGVSVHAGFPNPATDQSLHSLDFNQLLIQHTASTYMFRIEGSQWEDAGVFDGDIAIVDRALDPRKTDTVVWWQDGPEAFAVSPYKQVPTGATVWGVVTASIHQFRKPGRA
ncbi:MAG TPA: S24 family peptidase [Candidatus Saccharimonadales bacterium]|nr:S24 family peptidase [Candidatus Saccharimonadales bacterium]